MKKSVLATLMGVGLGVLMMIAVITVLNMKPSNEEMMAQNNQNSQTESSVSTEVESEVVGTEDVITEEESVGGETEEEGLLDTIIGVIIPDSEKESENKKPSSKPKEPVDYPYYIRVNRQANCVTVYKKDAEGNYTVPVKAMVCSVGLNNKTRLGVGTISDKYAWRELFGGLYGQYAVRFDGHILFHSVPYTQMKKDTLWEGQYNMLGQPASKGCVRLAAIDAKWIYDNCKKGTKVEVYDSPDPGPLGKPVCYQVSPDSPYAAWDPTDPDSANPWNQGVVSISGVKNIAITQGENVNLLDGIAAKDADGTAIEVKVVESIDLNVPGTYTITYSATGATRVTANATAVLTINAVVPPASEETEQPAPPASEEPVQPAPPASEETEQPAPPASEETEQPVPPASEETEQPAPPASEEIEQPAPPASEEPVQPAPPASEETEQPVPPASEEPANSETPGTETPATEMPETESTEAVNSETETQNVESTEEQ